MIQTKRNLLSPILIIFFFAFFIHFKIAEAGDNTEECLVCHADKDLQTNLGNGEILQLYISPDDFNKSMHVTQGVECAACHTDISAYPHPSLAINSTRELSLVYYQTCQKCHSSNYEKTLDSIHYKFTIEGNTSTPICTDCHGSHYIEAISEPRTSISTTCGQCHETILAEYKTSIHGYALLQESNQDVPVCTSCHGVHDIKDPTTPQFRNQNPELCASCHANKELMTKYGLSSDVYDIYNLSWHGVELSVFKSRWPTIQHESAVCSDCHGIHNIKPASDPQSSVNPNNMLTTCQKCHPNAGKNWTQAWTGHYPISLSTTPFLFYTNTFYQYFIPIILWVSIAYVLLQVLRIFVERARSIRK